MTGKIHNNRDFLEKLTEITETNLHNELYGVSELARDMAMSRSNLHRHIQLLLKISASQYMRQKRLEKGKDLLRHTSMTVSETAHKIGFGSVSYFIKCFHDYYGYPPGKVNSHRYLKLKNQLRNLYEKMQRKYKIIKRIHMK